MALIPPSIVSLRIVLASGSKQRLALLKQIGIKPTVRVSHYDENRSKDIGVEEFVREISRIKAEIISELMDITEYDIIIGCDSVVLFENDTIGKPIDEQDARTTLQRLNGNTHEVYTGVTIIDNYRQCEQFVERTTVKFQKLLSKNMLLLVNRCFFSGRAGSYAIQACGGKFVEKIDGCYYNVVGLPLNRLMKALWKK